MARVSLGAVLPILTRTSDAANKRELVNDFVVKAKQIDYLIQSLPEPEAEEVQVGSNLPSTSFYPTSCPRRRPTDSRTSRTKWRRQMLSMLVQ